MSPLPRKIQTCCPRNHKQIACLPSPQSPSQALEDSSSGQCCHFPVCPQVSISKPGGGPLLAAAVPINSLCSSPSGAFIRFRSLLYTIGKSSRKYKTKDHYGRPLREPVTTQALPSISLSRLFSVHEFTASSAFLITFSMTRKR